jgi:NADPH:quinone reductase
MKAIQITQFGGPDVMQLVDLPDPVPSDAEELIEVWTSRFSWCDYWWLRTKGASSKSNVC